MPEHVKLIQAVSRMTGYRMGPKVCPHPMEKTVMSLEDTAGARSVKHSSHREPTIARLAKGIIVITICDTGTRSDLMHRCIPKMDHHCPWTVNCVSNRTFPHFIRFLFYAVISMVYLGYLLYLRIAIVWESRNLPSVCLEFSEIYLIAEAGYIVPRAFTGCSGSALSLPNSELAYTFCIEHYVVPLYMVVMYQCDND